jgi:hypothetical protein
MVSNDSGISLMLASLPLLASLQLLAPCHVTGIPENIAGIPGCQVPAVAKFLLLLAILLLLSLLLLLEYQKSNTIDY